MAYASTADLTTYLSIDTSALPDDAARMLERASELINSVCQNRIEVNDLGAEDYVINAVCAQVEFWVQRGEETAFQGSVKSYSTGKVSFNYGDAQALTLAPRAKNFLSTAGLLYAGASMS